MDKTNTEDLAVLERIKSRMKFLKGEAVGPFETRKDREAFVEELIKRFEIESYAKSPDVLISKAVFEATNNREYEASIKKLETKKAKIFSRNDLLDKRLLNFSNMIVLNQLSAGPFHDKSGKVIDILEIMNKTIIKRDKAHITKVRDLIYLVLIALRKIQQCAYVELYRAIDATCDEVPIHTVGDIFTWAPFIITTADLPLVTKAATTYTPKPPTSSSSMSLPKATGRPYMLYKIDCREVICANGSIPGYEIGFLTGRGHTEVILEPAQLYRVIKVEDDPNGTFSRIVSLELIRTTENFTMAVPFATSPLVLFEVGLEEAEKALNAVLQNDLLSESLSKVLVPRFITKERYEKFEAHSKSGGTTHIERLFHWFYRGVAGPARMEMSRSISAAMMIFAGAMRACFRRYDESMLPLAIVFVKLYNYLKLLQSSIPPLCPNAFNCPIHLDRSNPLHSIHAKEFSHICPHNFKYCKSLGCTKHLTMLHLACPLCPFGAKCSQLSDPRHRIAFDHDDKIIRTFTVPCETLFNCRKHDDFEHYNKFYHELVFVYPKNPSCYELYLHK